MTTEWFEILPDKCPPDNAFAPNGQIYYRLSKSGNVTNDEFLSQRAKCPTCNFQDVSECIAHSISVWDDINKCLNILKLPRHKKTKDKAIVMQLNLNKTDGLLLNTFRPNHFSWWRKKHFNISSVSIIK